MHMRRYDDNRDSIPLLAAKSPHAASVFSPDALLREARRQKTIEIADVRAGQSDSNCLSNGPLDCDGLVCADRGPIVTDGALRPDLRQRSRR